MFSALQWILQLNNDVYEWLLFSDLQWILQLNNDVTSG
jgi:hypothetical protein